MGSVKVVHVAPDDSGWKVVQNGQTQSVHRTQKAAVLAGRTLASRKQAELVTHDGQGGIRFRDSSPLIRREILEAAGRPSVPRARIAAAARFTFRKGTQTVTSRSSDKRAGRAAGPKVRPARKRRVG